MKKSYTDEQKNEVLARFFAGEPIASISVDTGIAKSTLYAWSKSGEKKKKNKALNMTDYRILKQRCETLEKMVEILQLSPCAVSAPLHERYQVIKDLSDHYSINLLCQALKVAKGSYYNHILRNANENTSYMRKRKELTPIIEQIFHETNQVLGARKIMTILKSRGYKVAEKTVASIMHENGWFSIRGGSKAIYEMNKVRKENILNQQFVTSAPNEVWISDITYFKCKNTKYYICVIIDLFSRKVTLSKAYYERNPKAGLIFHTDQGANYTSHTFASFCKTLEITQSFSRKASPYDNSVMEAFFKTMKAEELYRNQYRSERHLRENIQNYIEFYNEKRPHQVNRYQTPNAIEEAYYKRHSEDLESLPFY